jgi:hypothetical protein
MVLRNFKVSLHTINDWLWLIVTATFADGQLIDAIKQLAADPTTDQKVKKKLMAVLASWHSQFKDDPSMSVVTGLFRQCRPADRRSQGYSHSADPLSHGPSSDYERKMKERDEKELAKQRAKREKQEAKQRARKAEEDARKKKTRSRKAPFDFEAVRDTHCQSHDLASN